MQVRFHKFHYPYILIPFYLSSKRTLNEMQSMHSYQRRNGFCVTKPLSFIFSIISSYLFMDVLMVFMSQCKIPGSNDHHNCYFEPKICSQCRQADIVKVLSYFSFFSRLRQNQLYDARIKHLTIRKFHAWIRSTIFLFINRNSKL